MRTHILLLLLFVAAAVGIGWRNQIRIAELEADQVRLGEQASVLGLAPDSTGTGIRRIKRPRPDPVAEARKVATGWLGFAEEMGTEPPSDEVTRQRMIAQMDQLMALNSEQLKVVINELGKGNDIIGSRRGELVYFALGRLLDDHPQDAVALMVESPALMMLVHSRMNSGTKNEMFEAVRRWAEMDPDAALTWFQKNRERLGDGLTDPEQLVLFFPEKYRRSRLDWLERSEISNFPASAAKMGLIYGTAERDPRMALRLIDEWIESPERTIQDLFGRQGQSPEQRAGSLLALRDWAAAHPAGAPGFAAALRDLAFGEGRELETTLQWIDSADLTTEELAIVTAEIPAKAKPEELARWVEWLGDALPEELARARVSEMFTRWSERNSEAAGQGLAAASAGPTRDTAVRAYVDVVAHFDPAAAAEWAVTIGEQDHRQETLREIYNRWPKEDPAARQAAEAFAVEHNIDF